MPNKLTTPTLKHKFYTACQAYAKERSETALKAIKSIQQAANDDTKNTAGDKHETGRAMMHLEREKADMQLIEAEKLLQVMERIDPEKTCKKVELGAIVTASNGVFFLAISMGKYELDGNRYWIISPNAPIAQAMLGKKAGEPFSFNGRRIRISSVL
ncbi:MAG: GreA/GreB family elongation factor [Bacteroidetes bacterium]|nr:GreA/GreB family elongation factor [Bacteroidota bacterium]